MLLKINRPRLWLGLFSSFFLLVSNCTYFNNLYGSNSKGIHSNLEYNSEDISKFAFLQKKQPTRKSEGYTFGVNVDLVMMYTSVFDGKGNILRGLEKEDFNVYEDGVRQEIVSFSRDDLPISMGIILDLSGTMAPRIEQVNKAARAFIEASNPQDEVFLVGFNDEVELLQEFTSDIDEITDALENAIVMGGTALYDAIYLGVEEAHEGKNTKKTIVVLTDGEDRDSVYSLNELIALVQETDVQIFCIFLDDFPEKGFWGSFSKSKQEKRFDILERISKESGSKAYHPDKTTDIHSIVSDIAHELRNQYSIGYISSNHARDGSWRRVVIRLDLGITSDPRLQYRRGYYAPKDP